MSHELPFSKGPGKQGHIVADTYVSPFARTRNKFCVREQTEKHLCRQHCVRNNVSSFARALTQA